MNEYVRMKADMALSKLSDAEALLTEAERAAKADVDKLEAAGPGDPEYEFALAAWSAVDAALQGAIAARRELGA